jgi:hypothetical protein
MLRHTTLNFPLSRSRKGNSYPFLFLSFFTEIPAVIRWATPKPDRPKRRNRDIAKFIVPHLLSSFSQAAFKVFFTFSLTLFILGVILAVFGVINKIFLITPESLRMANIVTYGLIFILISAVCELFAGLRRFNESIKLTAGALN